MDIYEDNFRKNVASFNAIGQNLLAERLLSVKGNERFEVFMGSDPIDINILDHQTGATIYNLPVADAQKRLEDFSKKSLYPFMAIFGFGNSILVKALLKNNALNRLLVFEPEIEILYIALHICNFAIEIIAQKLIVLYTPDFSFKRAMDIAKLENIRVYLKLYDLEITTPFYASYKDEISAANNIMIDAILQVVTSHGNDLEDALIGLDNFLINTPDMLENYPFELLKNQKLNDLAVCVATGPSLTKQLPLLKEIQNFVTIISVDASLPILEKHGIAPDIVTTLERIALTSMFFEKTSEEFQKKVGCFAISAVSHHKTIENIKGKKSVILRPFGYMGAFCLHDYGYAGIGMSAANLSYEIAFAMGYENIALIGQDLSYSEDEKSTHAEGHVFTHQDPSVVKKMKDEKRIYLPAWGSDEKKVRTNAIWVLFRNFFIQNIADANARGRKTYNCTEGGCGIDGAIHKPFAEVVNTFVKREKTKEPIKLVMPAKKIIKKHKKQVIKTLKEMIEYGEKVVEEVDPIQKKTVEIAAKAEKLTREEQIAALDFNEIEKLNKNIDVFKKHLQEEKFMSYFWDALQAMVINQELSIAEIVVRIIKTEEEMKIQNLDYMFSHRLWLFAVKGAMDSQLQILKRHRDRLEADFDK
ncbi:MAG: DUF115 domain-containing protein [Helicobacteraceae bacterium]|jgi:hypothetical protein|nr:DUF115 domain-containing protein [Helicobacteraceae bacterium]